MKTQEPRPLIVKHHPSPNFDDRPENTAIDTVVLHATVFTTLREVIDHFSNPTSRVSAHYTIDRSGTVACHVSEEKRAWHAGASKMPDGRESVNGFSIGIELVNLNDGIDPYPESQILSLRHLIANIKGRHQIRHIIRHADCAFPVGRKSDPLGFDLKWLSDLL